MLGRAHKIMCSDSKVRMQNYNLKFKTFEISKVFYFCFDEEKTSQEYTQIYPQRKGSDSPGSFRFERTGEINFRIISKTELPKEAKVKKRTKSSSPFKEK